ncbi:MAG: hypothetical protein ACYDEX_02270 [Mobilitalea sp.]
MIDEKIQYILIRGAIFEDCTSYLFVDITPPVDITIDCDIDEKSVAITNLFYLL